MSDKNVSVGVDSKQQTQQAESVADCVGKDEPRSEEHFWSELDRISRVVAAYETSHHKIQLGVNTAFDMAQAFGDFLGKVAHGLEELREQHNDIEQSINSLRAIATAGFEKSNVQKTTTGTSGSPFHGNSEAAPAGDTSSGTPVVAKEQEQTEKRMTYAESLSKNIPPKVQNIESPSTSASKISNVAVGTSSAPRANITKRPTPPKAQKPAADASNQQLLVGNNPRSSKKSGNWKPKETGLIGKFLKRAKSVRRGNKGGKQQKGTSSKTDGSSDTQNTPKIPKENEKVSSNKSGSAPSTGHGTQASNIGKNDPEPRGEDGSAEEVQVPEDPEIPQVLAEPKIPQVLEDPEIPQVLAEPKIPQVLEDPVVPRVPEDPEIPQVLAEPKIPQVLEDPVVPRVPEDPEIPRVPADPEVPQVPAVPEIPKFPEDREIPQVPAVPEIPQVPEDPVVPRVPEAPEIPNVPEDQEVQKVPEDRKIPGDDAADALLADQERSASSNGTEEKKEEVLTKKQQKAKKEQEKKARKQSDNDDKLKLEREKKEAEAAKAANEEKEKKDFKRVLDIYKQVSEGKPQPVIKGFDEKAAVKFLKHRIFDHRRLNNDKLAVYCSVVAENICPVLVSDSFKIYELRSSFADSTAKEKEMFATYKSMAIVFEACESINAGKTEEARGYARTFINNYVESQKEIRENKGPLPGPLVSNDLMKLILMNYKSEKKEAEAANTANEEKEKEDFKRVLDIYKQMAGGKPQPVIKGFDEKAAVKFLKHRIFDHRRRKNDKLAVFCSVVAENICPVLVSDYWKIYERRGSFADSTDKEKEFFDKCQNIGHLYQTLSKSSGANLDTFYATMNDTNYANILKRENASRFIKAKLLLHGSSLKSNSAVFILLYKYLVRNQTDDILNAVEFCRLKFEGEDCDKHLFNITVLFFLPFSRQSTHPTQSSALVTIPPSVRPLAMADQQPPGGNREDDSDTGSSTVFGEPEDYDCEGYDEGKLREITVTLEELFVFNFNFDRSAPRPALPPNPLISQQEATLFEHKSHVLEECELHRRATHPANEIALTILMKFLHSACRARFMPYSRDLRQKLMKSVENMAILEDIVIRAIMVGEDMIELINEKFQLVPTEPADASP